MKELILTTGEKAQVDDDDYDWASKHDWRLHTDGHAVVATVRRWSCVLSTCAMRS